MPAVPVQEVQEGMTRKAWLDREIRRVKRFARFQKDPCIRRTWEVVHLELRAVRRKFFGARLRDYERNGRLF